MTDRFAQLCLWTDESILLCKELQQVLAEERESLLFLKGEALAQSTMAKEHVVAKILNSRKKLKSAGSAWFGVDSTEGFAEHLTPEESAKWSEKHLCWKAEWKATCSQIERNQNFLKHSQKNLGRLIEHWRRLLGENPLYSKKGLKVESTSTGKVFEAKF
jgi:hypothetical protein